MSHKIWKLLKKKKRKPILLFLGILLGIAGLVFYAEEASQGASSGLNFCLHVLIPSTFPFLVLASLCVHSGVSLWLERLLRPVTQLLFHLPGCCGATILLGMVGGYPVGARGIAALYRQGSVTREQANRMLSFCVNAGPSFTISVIGSSLYGRPLFGLYLFASLTAASLLIGVGLGVFSRLTAKESIASPSASPETAPMPFGDALVVSASDASRGMVGACSFVLLFSSALALLQSVGFLPLLSQGLSALGISPASAEAGFPLLWEIGGGCGAASLLGTSPILVAFGVGFGGLCVQFQVLGFAAVIGPCRWKFFLSRLCHGLLSSGFCAILLWMFPMALPDRVVSVFHNTSQMLQGGLSAVNAPPLRAISAGGVLIVLCIVLILSNLKRNGSHRKLG